jgi:hypothetical protein
MAKSLTLVDPSIAAIFTIPASSWAAINAEIKPIFVSMVFDPDSMLQGTPLGNACLSWAQLILPGLHNQANALAGFSGTAIADLEKLKPVISTLKPNDPLPADVKAQALSILQPLASRTQALQGATGSLLSELQSFAAVIKEDDAEMRQDKPFGDGDWDTFFGSIDTVENAIGQVLGGWQAVSADLDDIASQRIDLSLEILISLQIDSAILAWTNIGAEARAYAANEPAHF